MIWLRTLVVGLETLLLHPLRSVLTVLGIFIGVASVIWLLAIGEGISRKAQQQIESLGADVIMVRSIKPPSLSGSLATSEYGLLRQDYERILETIPSIKAALPIREMRRQIRYGERALDGRLIGCTPEYAEATRLSVERGHFISDSELAKSENHCVLAASMAERLFGYEDPLRQKVYFPEFLDYYIVVGVMKSRNPTAAIGGSLEAQDFSNDVYIPITTCRQRIGDAVLTMGDGTFSSEILELNQITLRVNSVKDVLRTAELVKATLATPNHVKKGDVAVIIPLELLEQARTTRLMFMAFMGLVAAISLVVGGIGIMNIMLATVTERTREIGVRRALGATRAHILRQFLVETVTLSILGGILGIVGGRCCPLGIRLVRSALSHYAPHLIAQLPEVVREVEPVIVGFSYPLAFGISVAVGVIFGMYPAYRAAQMDPIEALRHA